MKMTFRWYGSDNDTVKLKDIAQIPGTEGIVWALHDIPDGEIWPEDKIFSAVNEIRKHGFHAEVVESVNVHEDIKLGVSSRDHYIENYRQNIKNLARYGVKVICYNFMPVFDWTRTDLSRKNEDGSTSLYYEHKKIENIEPQSLASEIANNSHGLILPGWSPERLNDITNLLSAYKNISAEALWQNLSFFLDAIIPVAEAHGITMAIHPDDPPWPILGLPRIITEKASLERLLSLHDSPNHCITLCTGSLGASMDNDIPHLVRTFCNRIAFMHIRNVKVLKNGDFMETSHRSCDGSIDIIDVIRALHENHYSGYVRPDHGRHLWDEKCRPGYGLYDRALGIMYIHGIWDTLNESVTSIIEHQKTGSVK